MTEKMVSELFGNTDKIEPEEVAQKTYDSEPMTADELQEVKDNLYGDDISGGLQNITVPPEELQKIKDQEEYAKEFIVINDDRENPERVDGVRIVLTPTELVLLKEILEIFSLNMVEVPHMTEVMGIEKQYDQQAQVRQLRDIIDGQLNEYVKYRPYSPWFASWIKKIGKKHARTM